MATQYAASDESYIDILGLFQGNFAFAYYIPTSCAQYLHTFDAHDSGSDIIRKLPWLEELVISEGLTYASTLSQTEQLLFKTYMVKDHIGRERSHVITDLMKEVPFILVLGEPGSGKTTILNYLLRYSDEFTKYREKHFITILTCNRDIELKSNELRIDNSPSHKNSKPMLLVDYVSFQLSELLNGLALDYNCTENDIYSDISERSLAKSIRKAIDKYRKGTIDHEGEVAVLGSLLQGNSYNTRVLKWFETHHPELTIDIVLDNIDCFPNSQRDDCLKVIINMWHRRNTKIIIPLRYKTFSEIDHTHPLKQFGGETAIIALPPSLFSKILEYRLTKIPDQLIFRRHLEWAEIMPNIAAGLMRGEIIELFNGIHGADTREKLRSVGSLLTSCHTMDCNRYGDPKSVLKALMLHEYMIAIPNISNLYNIFNNGETPGYQNTLVQLRILQFSRNKKIVTYNSDRGVIELHNLGYSPKSLNRALKSLLKRDFVYFPEYPGITDCDALDDQKNYDLCLSPIGVFYIERLIWNKTYISIMAQTCQIRNKFTRKHGGEYVVNELQQRIDQENDPHSFLRKLYEKNGIELFVALDKFIVFLKSEEEEESQNTDNVLMDYRIAEIMAEKFFKSGLC